jgi:hypothetical protein
MLREAVASMAKVAALHAPEWESAAAARVGDIHLHMDQELASVPIPPTIAGDEGLEKVYSDAMNDKREPFREGAIAAYQHCLRISVTLRWFNGESRHCEERLNELLPEEYPIAEEVKPPIVVPWTFIDVPGPILERKKEDDPNVSEIDPLEGL